MDSRFTFAVLLLRFLSATKCQEIEDSDDLHPCVRSCEIGAPPMECHYKFTVETYQSLSRACYDCPKNQTDCLRPHCVPADGGSRIVTTVNRRIPGPSIQVCVRDRIKVTVENRMATEETSIHWHGFHQRRTPYMDGVRRLTQCPITTGTDFQYSFDAEQIGTHFWHSHSGHQRGEGYFGALIVRQPLEDNPHRDLYDHDLPEHMMVVVEWTQKSVHDLYIHNIHNGEIPRVTTLLVNGLGYFYNSTHRAGVPPARFQVEKGQRYRFRFISAEFFACPTEVSVDNHTMTIISTDGFDVEPLTVTSFVAYAGERFDFVINADQEIDHYWIRFRGTINCQVPRAHQVAVLSYIGANEDGIPLGEPSYDYRREDGLQLNSLNSDMLKNTSVSIPELNAIHPDDESLKEVPDKKFYINYDINSVANPNFFHPIYYKPNASNLRYMSTSPQYNHIALAFTSFPLLSQRDEIKPGMFCNESTVKNCKEEFCRCLYVLEIQLNEVVEIILIDESKGPDSSHPNHLHGYSFRVIGMEKVGENVDVETIKEMDRKGQLQRKLQNAPLKDTVNVPAGGYTIIRFQATNPGYWLFHCHIDYHASLGMGLIFKVGEHDDMVPIPKNFPKCGNWVPDE